MSILKEINCAARWREFLAYKTEKSHLSKKDLAFLVDFIENEKYKTITENILNPGFDFSIPEKRLLNKLGKSKKRVIYTFSESENLVLKLITYLLYRYDNTQPPNCYSFRRKYGGKKAITTIIREKNIGQKYSCKIDIKDYFNKIDIELLLPILCKTLYDDEPLFCFLKKLLTADKAFFNGQTITEKRGVMAGTPMSPFLANIYLAEMDRFFLDAKITYARYSDDIIFFADSRDELDEYYETVKGFLNKYHLEINPDKVKVTEAGQTWDYLGISFDNGTIGLSAVTLKKIKGKIRRKARSIYRWKKRKDADNSRAVRVFARVLNRKFFGGRENDFTWTRWFFPLINTDKELKEIDSYIQEYARYVCSGRFNKANYRFRYRELKDCGYRNLVSEYYRFRQGKQ